MRQLIKQQLSDQVIHILQDAITSGKFGIGAKVPAEPLLMEELGVGRSTLREAIRVLAHAGILEVRQGDGTYVRTLPGTGETLANRLRRAKVREVQEVRRTLELEIVRLAAERRGKENIARVRNYLRKRKAALVRKDIPAALDADVAFHCAVAEATGNEVLADLYRTFALSLRDTLATLWNAAESGPEKSTELHQRLIDAIVAGDAKLAKSTTVSLLDRHDALISSWYSNQATKK